MRHLQTLTWILILTCLLISGCKTNERKAKEWAYNNKHALAEWCADCFPVKPSEVIEGKTVYLPGDTLVKTDTVTQYVDCPDGTRKPCPPRQDSIIRIPILRVDTIKVRDTAAEYALTSDNHALQEKVNDVSEELSTMTESRNEYRKWFWISMVVVAFYSILKIKRVV